MSFSTLIFIYVFLPVFLILYTLLPAGRRILLLLASLLFYAWGEPVYVILLLLLTAFNYFSALDLADLASGGRPTRGALILNIAGNLAVLAFFKYIPWIIGLVNSGTGLSIPVPALSLPVGLSFIVFRAMSYVFDVHAGKIKPESNMLTFALFLAMFPTLSMGPIDRYGDVKAALTRPRPTFRKMAAGGALFLKGLAKKVLLADTIVLLYQTMKATAGPRTVLMTWLGMLAFSFQLYFDFSGYSDMARGLGGMLGIPVSVNFDHPYTAVSVTDFWRRWHISLSSWFRDYIYIPLGGSRVTPPRHMLNLMVVWMATGLWHGASFSFIFWGLYYGVLLIVEKYVTGKYLEALPAALRRVLTFVIAVIGWTFFQSSSLPEALTEIKALFGIGAAGLADSAALYALRTNFAVLAACFIFATPLPEKMFVRLEKRNPALATLILFLVFVLSTAFMVYNTYQPFLYAQF